MTTPDRIHLAYCDKCGDEILEGDAHRVERERPKVFGGPIGSWSLTCRRVAGPTRYTCERCIAGEPKPSVPDVLPLVNAIYSRDAVGCCLHVMTDDGNVSDDDAKGCLETAMARGHADCEEAAGLLVRMSRTQRTKIALDLRRPRRGNMAGRER